jgi:hypothetical protein
VRIAGAVVGCDILSKSLLCLVAARHVATADSWSMSLSMPCVNMHILYHLRNEQKFRLF